MSIYNILNDRIDEIATGIPENMTEEEDIIRRTLLWQLGQLSLEFYRGGHLNDEEFAMLFNRISDQEDREAIKVKTEDLN